MKKDIINTNDKCQYHGYQEWYNMDYITLWARCTYKNGQVVGYFEAHGVKMNSYFIK